MEPRGWNHMTCTIYNPFPPPFTPPMLILSQYKSKSALINLLQLRDSVLSPPGLNPE